MSAPGEESRRFYDVVYYRHAGEAPRVSRHLQRLARHFGPWRNQKILDVACGQGEWLMAVNALGAVPAGVDISQVALDVCKQLLPRAELYCAPADQLPFYDQRFDVVSCLGALEHFLDPQAALREMVRVAKPNALFLLLVPNSGFLTRRLGFYSGTHQAELREDVRSLREWQKLFESAGLTILYRWRDLHVLSPAWIFRGSWYHWPLRAAHALALPFWPLAWQYQVYHLCKRKN
jgi:ubiquinone/menaquinone biosynthesis C-methylase UbiE